MEETYAGTTGWSGTSTSEDAASHRGLVQPAVMRQVERAGARGLTIRELRAALPNHHHGSLSSALTNLHRAGRIERLTLVRDRCKIYVTPGNVHGRYTEAPRNVVPRVDHDGPRVTTSRTPDGGWLVSIDTGQIERLEVDVDGLCYYNTP